MLHFAGGGFIFSLTDWWFGVAVGRSSHERSYSTLGPVSTGMGDRLWAGIRPQYVTKPTRSTQPSIPPGSVNEKQYIVG